MKVIETGIPDLVIIEPKVFGDHRGYFFESYSRQQFEEHGLDYEFIQDNESFSSYGVLRGLHFQKPPYAQTKLVRVIQGKVWDVAVDCRKGSPTYGEWRGVELSDENKRQFLVPQGFAHGFVVLSETATFAYKCDNFYAPDHEGGIAYNDANLNIDWKIEKDSIRLSEKDEKNPIFVDVDFGFEYKPKH